MRYDMVRPENSAIRRTLAAETRKLVPAISARIKAAAKAKPAWPIFQDSRKDCGKSIKQAKNGLTTMIQTHNR
jgi:hypothetical protein